MMSNDNLERRVEKLTSILDVAKAMAAARDLDKLLPLILQEAAKVVEADRCSLFIVDFERNELWTKLAQGTSDEIRLAIGSGIAGTVAKTGQAINLPDAYSDPRFNASVDRTMGYRTRSVLCVPMYDAQGTVVGVLQALNKKHLQSFNDDDQEFLTVFGGQAAGAIETALLQEEINRLFEGFVAASVTAIESRDPSTAGHSHRVAGMTVALARALEHVHAGPYARVNFSARDIQEIRYASILHDFGKVGVREAVLVKADKLYPHELELVRSRFDLARKDRQLDSYRRRLEVARAGSLQALAAFEDEENERSARELEEIEKRFEFVQACNRATVLPQTDFDRLYAAPTLAFVDAGGNRQNVLSAENLQNLTIPRGSLSSPERKEIESHVTHTFHFLSRIPWTRALRRVPEIAYAHHESLTGQGYPRGLSADQIPVQSRMMTIADVYDALTAADRPYKKAIPRPAALEILESGAQAGHFDSDLLRVFVEARIS